MKSKFDWLETGKKPEMPYPGWLEMYRTKKKKKRKKR